MKKLITIALASLLIACSSSNQPEYLIQYGGNEEEGTAPGYKNLKGEIIVEEAKYAFCFTDTIKNLGIVVTHDAQYLGIDAKGNTLFEIYPFDNGPDYVEEGVFRILKDGKIGYANMNGEVVIQPTYSCAFPFENGRAKVALVCEEIMEEEYSRPVSDEWFYINHKGEKVSD